MAKYLSIYESFCTSVRGRAMQEMHLLEQQLFEEDLRRKNAEIRRQQMEMDDLMTSRRIAAFNSLRQLIFTVPK